MSASPLIAKYQYEVIITPNDTIEDVTNSYHYIQKNLLTTKESKGVQIFVPK